MKALLIDDHPLILAALQAVIEEMAGHVTVIGANGARAARKTLAADPNFDLVLLDIHLGDADGFEVLKELRATHPALPVMVVSASDRPEDVLRALSLGAMGFVPKRSSNETIHHALRTVMAGGTYVPPMTLTFESSPAPATTHAQIPADVSARAESNGLAPFAGLGSAVSHTLNSRVAPGRRFASLGLTPRQSDVLDLLLQGHSNKLIARALNLSVETVKDHVAAVLRTLNVSSRTQAVLAVSQMGHHGSVAAWREARHG